MIFRSFLRGVALLSALLVGGLFAGGAHSEAVIPALTARVTDTTGTLDARMIQTLQTRLAELEQRKGAQIAVLMVPTTAGESIEQYAVRAFEQWKLGRAKVDDGVLLVIAKQDRALRIEVGYGLEGAIPDLVAGRIINEQIVPHFRDGDFSAGVVAGIDSLIKRVDGEDLPAPPASESSEDITLEWWGWLFLFMMAIGNMPIVAAIVGAVVSYFIWESWLWTVVGSVVMFAISALFRSARKGGGGGGGGRRGGWGSGGGFGGGGFGGFGGGGGRSGGGGASGRW